MPLILFSIPQLRRTVPKIRGVVPQTLFSFPQFLGGMWKLSEWDRKLSQSLGKVLEACLPLHRRRHTTDDVALEDEGQHDQWERN